MPSFNAAVGTRLLLEVEGNEKRFVSFLVGYVKDKFILITTPSAENLFSARPLLFANRKINVRYIEDGKAIGFQSKLIKGTEDPARLLFLSYPAKIENHELRTNKRVSCALPAELDLQGIVCNSVIIDINQFGLRIHIKDAGKVASILEQNPVGQECTIRFFLPGESVLQEVSGEVRNYEHKNRRNALGIKYTNISDENRQKIIEFESQLII